jgi:hypothetical protein
MTSSRVGDALRDARLEIAELLSAARMQPGTPEPSRRMSVQENCLRYVVVGLVALLQMYVAEKLEETADNLPNTWDTLTDLQKRYVAVNTRRRLEGVLASLGESELAEAAKVNELKRNIEECIEWHKDPSSLARSTHRHSLRGLLHDNSSRTIDKAISQLKPSGMKFSDWLFKNRPRYRGIFDTLDTVIATRNDVAHGTFQRRVTVRDVRQYRVLVCRLIGKMEEYLQQA